MLSSNCSSIQGFATALKQSMATVLRSIEPVDQDFLDGLIVRWKLAEQYVEDLEMVDSLPTERALKTIMQHDVPLLLKEIIRLLARVKLTESQMHRANLSILALIRTVAYRPANG